MITILDSRVLAYNPSAAPTDVIKDRCKSIPAWITSNSTATLFMDDMVKPRCGTLIMQQDSTWSFYAGRGKNRTPINLPNLHCHAINLGNTSQMVREHPPFFNAQHPLIFKQSVARHILAANLDNIDTPTLLNIHCLSSSDQAT